jgi:hypothetical protein
MASVLNKLLGWLCGPQPRLRCSATIWAAGVAELARRTNGGMRESGAYLLGVDVPQGGQRILEFVFYDDIDPHALDSGIVTIRQTALPRLWGLCRARGYGVVADVHVHPFGYQQSPSDQANPVMPRSGHIAMILPDFATGEPRPGNIGLYEFQGAGRWLDHTHHGVRFLKLERSR